MNNNKLIIFSAPSGSGKSTIINEVLKSFQNLEFSVSACSRKARKGETNGKDYYFLSIDEFKQKIDNNEFVEWEEVYKDHFYGTLKSELQRIWDKGNHVVFDLDVAGGINLKKKFPNNSLSIFIKAPSIDELERRLKNRATENEEQIKKRINKAEEELKYSKYFDEIIINDDLAKAVHETKIVINNFLNSKK